MGLISRILNLKNRKTNDRAEELYRVIIEDSRIRLANELEATVTNDSNGGRALSNILEYCAILYQPENCKYYAVFDEKGNVREQKETEIPIWFPQNYEELVKNCTILFYGTMSDCLKQKEQYLAYPKFDEMEKNIEQLSLEECMQFFLFYNRLSLRHGQQYFFEKWKDGTALRVINRMQTLRKIK